MADHKASPVEKLVMDPDSVRDQMVAAALVLRDLVERDLPVARWDVDPGMRNGRVRIVGYIWRSKHDAVAAGTSRNAVREEALRRWAEAFDAVPLRELDGDEYSLGIRFSYAGVEIEISTLMDRPDEPETEEAP